MTKKKAPTNAKKGANKGAKKNTKAAAPKGTKGTRKKTSVPKQTHVPGTERPKQKDVPAELKEAARSYEEKRDQRMKWGEDEVRAQGQLHQLMKKHKIEQFFLGDDTEVFVEHGEDKVRVRAVKKNKKKKEEAA